MLEQLLHDLVIPILAALSVAGRLQSIPLLMCRFRL